MTLKINGATGGSVSLDAPDNTSPAGTDVTLTLPTSAGSSGQYLQTNGSGTLSWQTVSVPTSFDNITEGNTTVECVDTGSDGHITFDTEGTERMRITSSGSVQISQEITNAVGKSLLRGNTSAVTFYVSNSGNDSTGDGSSGSPYRTVNHAAKQIPNILTSGTSYTIRVLGSSYTPSGDDNIIGNLGAGEFSNGWTGKITLYADTAGCTWDLNSGDLYIAAQSNEVKIERFAFQCGATTATGRIDVQDCKLVYFDSTNTFTSGHQGGWAWAGGIWCKRVKYMINNMDFAFTSSSTGGLGGPILYEACDWVSHGGDVIKSGTQHSDHALTFINGTNATVGGTLSNFAYGIRLGVNHYGNETGAYIAVNGATISNCVYGISAETGSHVKIRTVNYSGNSANTATTSNGYIG